jgi:MoxR-like ATPase
LTQAGQVIVGQRQMLERLLIGLVTGGHVLLEGVPGLAKTLTVKTLSDCLALSFKRIQFTPDLLPADLIGTQIYQPQTQSFTVKRGPLFANLILADEINRAPAKVQSALLESMQERQVTIGDQTFQLPSPFLVLATENPIEQEGTYPLPEAQVDRFMLKVKVGYPTRAEELVIMDRVAGQTMPKLQPVVSPAQLQSAAQVVREIYIDPKVKDYIVSIVVATRDVAAAGLKEMEGYIEYGASPRATIYLNLAARAHAFLKHRGFVTPEDVKAVAYDVLRHRVSLTYEAEAENLTSEKIIQKILEKIEVP